MKYQTGQVGRCIVARFEDGDPILDALVEIARKEDIRAAIVYLIGSITEATIVAGPDKEELSPGASSTLNRTWFS
jgi:predicted DNA-binding protein with PD1-like motif